MGKYVIERNLPSSGITDEELEKAAQSSLKVLTEMPNVEWIRSFLTTDKTKFFCIYEAPDAEACHEHAERAGLPIDKVSEVEEITPDMFITE